jgi:glucose/arabinose dehydrogenase
MNMMHALKNAGSAKLARRLAALSAAVAVLALAGCDDHGGDPRRQIGANPVLPQLQQYLMPPIRIAKVVRWGNETPTVPQELQIHALATGFEHPRSLYVLPNGDVLVVESNGPKAPIYRPKDIITGWVQWFAGAKAKDANRITLLRDTNGDGVPELRTVFLDHLNSPFGVALIGHDLYVADTDAIIRYPYQDGQTSIGHQAHRSSWRTYRSSLDKGSVGQSGRLQALRRRRIKQQHRRKRNWRRI